MKFSKHVALIFAVLFSVIGCITPGEDTIRVTTVDTVQPQDVLKSEELAKIEELKKKSGGKNENSLNEVINRTTNYAIAEYLSYNPHANNSTTHDFSVGGYDVIDITVYEEADLSRENVRISADGYISFPLIGRIKVEGLTTSEIEERISHNLAAGQFLLNAHVSVTVKEFRSKQFKVLGSVKNPGSYPLQARERMLDAISRAGGIDFEQGGKHAMIIRTENPDTDQEGKIVIRIELSGLLKGGDQKSNIILADKDLIYIPKAENFYIIGQVKNPGSYPYLEKEITLVGAISRAGGFTPAAARNRTRVVRVEDGRGKIIEVRVDAITEAGKKGQDVLIQPGDVIVVPEGFF
ncbi:MAG: hypothetical protein B6245_16245 [Desulfobacteraceae bacterium 4572_88]|nr:MAG: hypothetical protein B6245_16245 [Desulfobacteraceae bacterium 4572_88]